jgi:hypothetical protein
MDYLETVTVRILEKHRVIIVAVLGGSGRALDILPSNPANYFSNSIDLFACIDPERDTSRIRLVRRIFCKAEESLSRKGFTGRCAPPFSLRVPPPHRKSKLGEKGPIEVGHSGKAAHAQINVAKGVSAHRMLRKLEFYGISPLIDSFLGPFQSDGFGLADR